MTVVVPKPQWYEMRVHQMIKKFIRYLSKYSVLHCVLSARLRIDTWIHHGTSRVKLALVQLASYCNE